MNWPMRLKPCSNICFNFCQLLIEHALTSSLIAHTDVPRGGRLDGGARELNAGLSLHLHTYFECLNSDGSGESVHLWEGIQQQLSPDLKDSPSRT